MLFNAERVKQKRTAAKLPTYPNAHFSPAFSFQAYYYRLVHSGPKSRDGPRRRGAFHSQNRRRCPRYTSPDVKIRTAHAGGFGWTGDVNGRTVRRPGHGWFVLACSPANQRLVKRIQRENTRNPAINIGRVLAIARYRRDTPLVAVIHRRGIVNFRHE